MQSPDGALHKRARAVGVVDHRGERIEQQHRLAPRQPETPLAWAVQLKMTAGDVLALPFYHPTMEESFRTVLRDLAGQQTS